MSVIHTLIKIEVLGKGIYVDKRHARYFSIVTFLAVDNIDLAIVLVHGDNTDITTGFSQLDIFRKSKDFIRFCCEVQLCVTDAALLIMRDGNNGDKLIGILVIFARSEERRVGKECRSRW